MPDPDVDLIARLRRSAAHVVIAADLPARIAARARARRRRRRALAGVGVAAAAVVALALALPVGGGRSRVEVTTPPSGPRHAPTPPALGPHGIGATRFGQPATQVLATLDAELGPSRAGPPSGHTVCGVVDVGFSRNLVLFFDGAHRFVGYASSGRALRLGRLRIGMTAGTAERLFGHAFTPLKEQGGAYRLRVEGATVDGFLAGGTAEGVPRSARVLTIDAGEVGCPAQSP